MGPYHRDRESAEIAECKISSVMQRTPQFRKLQDFVHKDIVQFVKMYDRKLEIEPESLSLMLTLDAFLLSPILLEYASRNYPLQNQRYDTYVLPRHYFWTILRDLMLMENQILIEILKKAMELIAEERNLEEYVYRLIGFVYPFKSPQFARPEFNDCHHLLEYFYLSCMQKKNGREKAERSDYQIPSATQLQDQGICFKAENGDLDSIKFDPTSAILHLPTVKMYSETETWFRNLITYEQCRDVMSVQFSSYTRLMGCLIETSEDVRLLRKKKVLMNLMGSDEAAASVWNTLGLNVELFLTKGDYELMKAINKHCSSRGKV